MVHRPADSRLLTNLLSHEKEYTKAFSNVFDVSQTAIASFSAYASASAPPTSRVIVTVAGALAGADAALRGYAASVEQWQIQLKALKEAEEAFREEDEDGRLRGFKWFSSTDTSSGLP